ncbi:MAG: serine/threonine-protein kinase, partial [Isosphaeraceae bacterium]
MIDPERALLFGLLALQIGLIGQGQLVAAFQAWTRDRSISLAGHLNRRGDLTDSECALLESLVDQHIQRFGGDPGKSLAAIPIDDPARQSLISLAGPEFASDQSRTDAAPDDGEGDPTASYRPGGSDADGPRFRILRPHARGGLGAVFVAIDSELNREVALKQILDRHADDPRSRQRFLVEAEITGGLEHPGIVPVYGLGTYRDGRPYYAMRFVRGDSLKEAIARFRRSPAGGPARILEFRTLLRRFTDVCNALDYAHARGVIHRDIKPANVIVGKHGETLVVDWGLAKALGRSDPDAGERTLLPASSGGSAETLPGQALGTPAYMSPEQARGDLEAIGPRSDVYSLGATLFTLLTGKAPIEGADAGIILRKAEAGVFPKPRQLDSSIDPALEAIALKAMARDPGERYPSCRALAEDLDRWLAGERVEAYREPWLRGLNRWLSKHRTAVTGAAAAGVALMIGLASVAAVQARANADLKAQRTRAEEREQLAIDAVKRFRDAVADNPELKDNPSLESLRKTLLREPLAFFADLRERLQADRDTRPVAMEALAIAIDQYARLADEVGDVRNALRAADDGREIWERMRAADPGNPRPRDGLATVQLLRANYLRATGKLDEAREAFEQAREIREQLAREHPDDLSNRSNLSACCMNLAGLMSDTGRLEEALALYEQAGT